VYRRLARGDVLSDDCDEYMLHDLTEALISSVLLWYQK
jgi:hypothetical protein